jgi:hypothetical protein
MLRLAFLSCSLNERQEIVKDHVNVHETDLEWGTPMQYWKKIQEQEHKYTETSKLKLSALATKEQTSQLPTAKKQ